MSKAELIKLFIQNNYLLKPELLKTIPDMEDYSDILNLAKKRIKKQQNVTMLTEDTIKDIICPTDKKEQCTSCVDVCSSYDKNSEKKEIQDFVKYFRARYEGLKKILMSRMELQNAISISRVLEKSASERVAVIGIVSNKAETKNGTVILTIEDITGTIKVLITKKNEELIKVTQEIVLDEVIGISGNTADKAIFANNILFPDVPATKELKKSPEEAYVAFISDIHVGSNMFLPEEFMRFINWTNGNLGTEEQKAVAMKVKYLFIIGDLVDGIGIYPDQDKELLIKDIYNQYEKCAEYLSLIRKDIKIIICGGNHDALRISEPQPCLDRKYAKAIYELPNVTIVSNPATVNIHASSGFPGFDVLMYHGYSFDYYVANVNNIRNNGGYDRADLIMKFLLQKRHLAPTHSSTLYIPEKTYDPLIIDKIPDFFVTGHIHKANINSYKGVSTISGSCWQAKTSFQEKVGHNPEPARVPLVNLRTRAMTMMRFDN